LTDFADRPLEERLNSLAGRPGGGDWLDVRRRAEALQGARRRRKRKLVLAFAAALLVVVLVAVPALGLGHRLLEFFSLERSDQPVPALQSHQPVPYVLGDKVVGLRGARTLAQPLQAPLLGAAAPVALLSPDEKSLVYHTWTNQTPTLRILDLRSGSDRALEPGTQSAAWRSDGALAYWRADPARYSGSNYIGDVVVRESDDVPVKRWSSQPGPYQVSGWAGSTLLATVERCLTCKRDFVPGVIALDRPRHERRLPLSSVAAISPNGRLVLGGFDQTAGQDSPSPFVRVVDVRTGRVVTTVDLRRLAGRAGNPRWFSAGVGPGSWLGNQIVVPTSFENVGTLVFLNFARGRLDLQSVARVDASGQLSGGYGPFFSRPVFADGSGRHVVVGISVPSTGSTRGYRGFLTCDRLTSRCLRGAPLPRGRSLSIVEGAPEAEPR
jgi:hypothetical protein